MADHLITQKTSEEDYDSQFENVTSARRISSLLRPLLKKHAIVTATLPNSDQFFNTVLLAVDPDNDLLVIDGLHPEEGHCLLTQAQHLTLRTQLAGVEINFSIKLKSVDSTNGIAFYNLEFPKNIRYLQKRSAFRASISAAKDIVVKITTPDNKIYTGELHDISAGGMCVRIPRKKALALSEYKEETQCAIILPDKRQIRCIFRICRSSLDEPSDCLLIGGHFEKLDKIQRRTIERFVVELQRLSAKNTPR
jgi:c-di-GMP-binding flagellar brake protein YcgR